MDKPKQGNLFGGSSQEPRGWTELDKLRLRYAQLERRVTSGEYKAKDLDELTAISEVIIQREQEAREKWAKSFKA